MPAYSPFSMTLMPSLWQESSQLSAMTSPSAGLFQPLFNLFPPQT